MKDDGLHEVQLNGKQLVFAFMVATVVAVVVFLLGVLVGRGLRPASQIDLTTAASTSNVDPTLSDPTASEPSSAATPAQSGGTPISAREALTYAERLESPTPLPDDLREPEPKPAAKPPDPVAEKPPPITAKPAPETVKPSPAPITNKPAAPAAAADASLAEPAGPGFVVQVMAVNTRVEADAVARRLAAKGYPTFVTTTGAGAQVTYRVRVGKYATQREADAVSARLQKEEQFKPWVTR